MYFISGVILAVFIGGFTTPASSIDAATYKYPMEMAVDEELPILKNFIHRKGLDSIQIPDFFYPTAPIFIDAKLRNLSTIYRKGDAVGWEKGPKSFTVQVIIGLKDMELDVEYCSFMRSGVTCKIGEAAINVTLTLSDEGKEKPCVMVWESFLIEEMKDVVFVTENPEWNGKSPPDTLLREIIDHYNKWNNVVEMRDRAGKYLNLCYLP